MPAYYNEIDPYAAQWLRNLIAAGHIAPGDVDERSIVDVRSDDLRGYTQCHFFAGIGVWSYALRLAGWPDDRPVWTGSCPCQPFSAAGKGDEFGDERHLTRHRERCLTTVTPCKRSPVRSLRADEGERKGLFGEDINIRFPMREWGWGLSHVWNYLTERGITIPARTDCASCYHQRLGEWWNLWRDHPDSFERAAALERRFGHTFRSEERDTWPAALDGLRDRFKAGEIPRGVELNLSLFQDESICRVCTL